MGRKSKKKTGETPATEFGQHQDSSQSTLVQPNPEPSKVSDRISTSESVSIQEAPSVSSKTSAGKKSRGRKAGKSQVPSLEQEKRGSQHAQEKAHTQLSSSSSVVEGIESLDICQGETQKHKRHKGGQPEGQIQREQLKKSQQEYPLEPIAIESQLPQKRHSKVVWQKGSQRPQQESPQGPQQSQQGYPQVPRQITPQQSQQGHPQAPAQQFQQGHSLAQIQPQQPQLGYSQLPRHIAPQQFQQGQQQRPQQSHQSFPQDLRQISPQQFEQGHRQTQIQTRQSHRENPQEPQQSHQSYPQDPRQISPQNFQQGHPQRQQSNREHPQGPQQSQLGYLQAPRQIAPQQFLQGRPPRPPQQFQHGNPLVQKEPQQSQLGFVQLPSQIEPQLSQQGQKQGSSQSQQSFSQHPRQIAPQQFLQGQPQEIQQQCQQEHSREHTQVPQQPLQGNQQIPRQIAQEQGQSRGPPQQFHQEHLQAQIQPQQSQREHPQAPRQKAPQQTQQRHPSSPGQTYQQVPEQIKLQSQQGKGEPQFSGQNQMKVVKRDNNNLGPKSGRKIVCEVNYFNLNISPKSKGYHYDVTITPDLKKFKFEVMKRFFAEHFPGFYPVFDGMKNSYSCGRLPNLQSGFISGEVTISEQNRPKPLAFKVEMKVVAEIDFTCIKTFLQSDEAKEKVQTAIQCLDVVLRYGALCRFIKVGRSLFAPPRDYPYSLGGGLEVWHGSYQSALLKSRPLFNFDIAHKDFIKKQNVLNLCFELFGKDKECLSQFDVERLNQILARKKIEFQIPNQTASKRSYTVNKVVEPSNRLSFDNNGRKTNVCEYFEKEKRYRIKYPNLPCLWVGAVKGERKVCLPLELCTILEGQVSMKKLDEKQTSEMIKITTCNATDRKKKIMEAFGAMRFGSDDSLKAFGIEVGSQFEKVNGRVIPAPDLSYSNTTVTPKDGVWRAGTFKASAKLDNWVVLCICQINPNAVNDMIRLLINVGRRHGMQIKEPAKWMRPDTRSLKEDLRKAAMDKAQLVMVVFDDWRGKPYSSIKQCAELEEGVLTQCVKKVTVERKMNDSTASQLLLKINSKLDQINHTFDQPIKPKCLKYPCMIMGADVTHPSPGLKQALEPSISAVAASHCPQAFKYNITLRLQPSKEEMIEDLFTMVREQLLFFKEKTKYLPKHIIMFRDGVSDGQFEQVLNIELRAIYAACKDIFGSALPKVTYLVVQKRHHTRFFPVDPKDGDKNMNVPVGTCIDTVITNPNEVEFYLLSHASIRGMARPTRYYKLWDDANMTDSEIEELAYYLCHMFTRCNRSVSYPAPTYYAHLAAARAKALIDNKNIDMQRLPAEQGKIKVLDRFKECPMFFV